MFSMGEQNTDDKKLDHNLSSSSSDRQGFLSYFPSVQVIQLRRPPVGHVANLAPRDMGQITLAEPTKILNL